MQRLVNRKVDEMDIVVKDAERLVLNCCSIFED